MSASAALITRAEPRRVFEAAVALVDIEGAISPAAFVKTTLFPYAAARLRSYVARHRFAPGVAALLEEARQLSGGDPVEALEAWQANDVEAKPLKTLQDWIWEEGYSEGAFAPEIFDDALAALRAWRAHGVPLYVYSSGSVKAQKLFFRYARAGDLRTLFSGHFDASIGPKTELESYLALSAEIGVAPAAILFLSDNPAELEAAASVGLQVGYVAKEVAAERRWPPIRDFGEIELIRRH